MRRETAVLFFALPLISMGCAGRESPLPPEAALATAAERIEEILAEEQASAANARPLESTEAPGNDTAVSFWFYAHPVMSALMGPNKKTAAFNNTYGVAVDPQFVGEWPTAVQKLTVNIAVGEPPDVALVERGWLARLASSGLIMPLDAIVSPALVDDLRQPVRDSLTANGRLYGFPADGFCSVLFYRKDLVEDRVPNTWESLRQEAVSLKKTAPQLDAPMGYYPYLEGLWSAGGAVVHDGRCTLQEPPALATLSFLLQLREEGLTKTALLEDPAYAMRLFEAGRTAMTVGSSSHLEQAGKLGFPVGVAPVPGKDGPVSSLANAALVVFQRHAYPKRHAIESLLDYLSAPQIHGVDIPGSVPVRKSIDGKHPALPQLEAAFEHGQAPALIPPWSSIEFELYRQLGRAFRWERPVKP
jgi:multiple sugar transport system substrate-binding protein